MRKKGGKKQSEQAAPIINQGYELVDVSRLVKHPRNPRKGNVGEISASIEANGFYGAVVVQRSSCYILAGNHTYDAAIQERMEQIPVIWVDCDDARALKIVLADNKTADDSTYDNAILAELLAEISNSTGSMDGTGYSQAEYDKLITSMLPKEERTKDDEPELNSSWAVMIECTDEEQQTELLTRLSEEGLNCRALTS